jgi:hypothetical protein
MDMVGQGQVGTMVDAKETDIPPGAFMIKLLLNVSFDVGGPSKGF